MTERDNDRDAEPEVSVRDRRRFDPVTGDRLETEEISLPGGGVLKAHQDDERPEWQVSFAALVQPFYVLALTSLGVIPNPESGRRVVDLAAAKAAIGLLEILKDKTEGRLTEDERRLLDEALFGLRLQFVEVRDRS